MMEAIKGIARRTTQSIRETVSASDATPQDEHVCEVAKKVRVMEAKSQSICAKIIRAARLMEDLGTTLLEIGEEYKLVPDLATESLQLAGDVAGVGAKLVETSREHQLGLKDNGFDLLNHFTKECSRMKAFEETERHHQLEHDFFKAKVVKLRQSPQKDFTRIPRNEQILENWRVELWRVSEGYKALLSSLYLEGRSAIDRSVLTTVQVLNSFVDIAATGFKQTFYNARLPQYATEPVLPPAPLPPNPNRSQQGQLAITDGGGCTTAYHSSGEGGSYYPNGSAAAPPPPHVQQQPWTATTSNAASQLPSASAQSQLPYAPQPQTQGYYGGGGNLPSSTYQPPVVEQPGGLVPSRSSSPYQPPR